MTKNLTVALLIALSSSVYAEDGFDDGGFDDGGFDQPTEVEYVAEIVPEKATSITGSVALDIHYNTKNNLDYSRLNVNANIDIEHKMDNGSKIRSNIKANKDLIFNSGLSNFTVTPSGYESDIGVDQLSIENSISDNVDIKIGRQIVTWGVSDLIRVNDVLNPTDNRVPGLVDIKDLKIGRTMTKVDYYTDGATYQAVLLHENIFSKYPRYGSDFKSSPDITIEKPDSNIKNTGLGLSIKKSFTTSDLSLYYLNTYADKPYMSNSRLNYDNRVSRYGIAYNEVYGGFLLKAEVSYEDKVKYNESPNMVVEKPVTKALLGFDYNGFKDTSVTYEVSKQRVGSYTDALNNQQNGFLRKTATTQALRVSKRYMNDTLSINATAMIAGVTPSDGGVFKLGGEYDIDDVSDVKFGYIDYLSSESNPAVDANKDNDRIYLTYTYKF